MPRPRAQVRGDHAGRGGEVHTSGRPHGTGYGHGAAGREWTTAIVELGRIFSETVIVGQQMHDSSAETLHDVVV